MIERSEVEHVARLARLKFDPREAEHLAQDLGRIVEYIDTLAEAELPDEGDALTYFDHDVLREDRAEAGLDHDEALRNAPVEDGTFFVVPQIVDKEDA